MGLIYLATNKINGKQYVGKTKDTVDSRKHCHEKGRGGCGVALAAAIRKYGPENFVWEVLKGGVPDDRLNQEEREWIWWLGTKAPGGYNLTDGGDGLFNPSQEVRAKISDCSRKTWSDPEWRRGRIEAAIAYYSIQSNREAVREATLLAMSRPEVVAKILEGRDPVAFRIAMAKSNADPASIAKRAASLKKLYADPEFKEYHRAACRRGHRTEAARANHSRASRIANNDPVIAAKRNAAMKKGMATPESKAKRSKSTKKYMSDPVVKERHRKAVLEWWRKRKEAAGDD